MSVVLATGGYDHKIRFWEAPSGKCTKVIKFPDSQLNRLEITPDKQFIAAAGNPLISVYEIDSTSSDKPALTIEGHTSNVTSLGFHHEGRYLYSGSEDGTIRVWDLRNPKHCRIFDSQSPVNSVTLRIDRDEFISGDQNGNVKVWDIGGNGCITSVQPTECAIQAVDVSEDSRTLVAVSGRGSAFVWDPSGSTAAVAAAEVGAEGNDILRFVTKFRVTRLGDYCLHAKISPDCRNLVTTGSDGLAKLWDTTTWELTQSLQNQKWVWDAAFCADSSYLVTASSDHVARLWNLRNGDVVRQYRGHSLAVTCVALNDCNA